MRRNIFLLACCFSLCQTIPLFAQQTNDARDAIKIGSVTLDGWFRTRGEAWDWFKGNANNQYAFSESLFRLGFSQSTPSFDWRIEVAIPILLGIPSNAIAPGAQGQLGFGGSYYANSKAAGTASIFPKQVYGRFKFGEGPFRQSLLVGRSEFFDGAEGASANKTLATLQKERIAQRLIGNFGFADVSRSFDGGVYSLSGSRTNVTLFGARTTRGVFQVDGWGEVNADVFYGAVTRQIGGGRSAGVLRLFGIGYNDYRGNVLKTDNRPTAVRAADHTNLDLGTVGGNYLHALTTRAGVFDLLGWGAWQFGSWGTLTQRAYAFAGEGGWQLPLLVHLKPWLRGGYNYGSGDKNPNDATHGTFFQMLPTARQYARFPFFNMMNNRDAFGELVLRPAKAVTIRTDIHSLALANRHDLWYSGGGVFQPWTFGFTGRPSNGQTGLATLFDGSLDYTLNRHFAFALYYGYAAGKLVITDLYPKGNNANFGYVEANYRF